MIFYSRLSLWWIVRMHFRKPTIINRKLSLLIGNKCYFEMSLLWSSWKWCRKQTRIAIYDIFEFSHLMRIMPQVYTRTEVKRKIISGSTPQFSFHVGIRYLYKSKFLADTRCSCLLSVSTAHRLILRWSHWLINCSIKNDLYKHLRDVF